jgi:hypothetical protein
MRKMSVYRTYGDRNVVRAAVAKICIHAANFGASESKRRRNEYFKGVGVGDCFSALNIFSVIEPNKIKSNQQM